MRTQKAAVMIAARKRGLTVAQARKLLADAGCKLPCSILKPQRVSFQNANGIFRSQRKCGDFRDCTEAVASSIIAKLVNG